MQIRSKNLCKQTSVQHNLLSGQW